MSINKIINFKDNIPQNVKNALNKIGNNKIISARVGRTPVQAVIQGALKAVATVPYDNLFHLFIIWENNQMLKKLRFYLDAKAINGG